MIKAYCVFVMETQLRCLLDINVKEISEQVRLWIEFLLS